jgi:hypothetical protein
MRVQVKSACLHGPFFMEGVNYGDKLGDKDAKVQKPVELIRFKNETEDGIIVIDHRKQCASVIPITSIASWIPKDAESIGVKFESTVKATPVFSAPIIAQVEHPAQPKVGRTKQ